MSFAFLRASFNPKAIAAERMRRSLALFCQRAWSVIDPEPLVWNWHLDLICACLEAVSRDELNDLLINIPPGHAKSMLVSVLWPAWEWTWRPTNKVITSSYVDALVNRDAVRFRDLITSHWYREHFVDSRRAGPDGKGGPWIMKSDQNLKGFMQNTAGGQRIGVSTGSGTGQRANVEIVDDPLSAETALSKIERETAVRWFFETMSSRFVDQNNMKRVIIMQRLHADDLAGEALRRGGFSALVLPTEFVPGERAEVWSKPNAVGQRRLIARDPRTVEGELLFPARFPREAIDLAKSPRGMGAMAFAAQHQQKPSPPEGHLIKRAWFSRRWKLPGESDLIGAQCRVLPRPDVVEIYTDAAFKKTDVSDRVAIGVFGLKWPDLYLLDLVWDRMTFTETLQAIRDLRVKWKRASAVRIEDKANGSAIIDTLKQEIPGVIGIEPEGGKESRITAASRFIEAGNLWLPAYALEQTGALIEEAVSFPKASHDDGIDMVSYAINTLLTDSDMAFLLQITEASKHGS